MTSDTTLLQGQRALILGASNQRSLAWAIAEEFSRQGAEIALSYQHERHAHRLNSLIDQVRPVLIKRCDVSDDQQIEELFTELQRHWQSFDILVHAIAFASPEAIENRLTDLKRADFLNAMDISAYSLIALAQRAEPFLKQRGGSIITLSYYGARKVIPGYNVMGIAKAALENLVRYMAAELGKDKIRVNAISAGPIKTISSTAIANFNDKLEIARQRSPLSENITAADVAAFACFLAGPYSRHVTGGVHYVDAGLSLLGA